MSRGMTTRRRFIAISGAFAGLAVASPSSTLAGRDEQIVEWHGTALGAQASIRLSHPDRDRARLLISRCIGEIRRLESIFSLYESDSALAMLNRDGHLSGPPPELVELLDLARGVSAATDGAFDVTVQPLWRRYAEHFSAGGQEGSAPDVDDVLRLVDFRSVDIDGHAIRLARSGMAVTLNGIAQGYITDRVAALLRSEGIGDLLLDLGELLAAGEHPDGRPWRAGIRDPQDLIGTVGRLDLRDVALATSGGYGTVFDREGRFTHLLDPRTGRSAPARRGVSVLAASAAIADGYSTAFSLMSDEDAAAVAERHGGMQIYVAFDGTLTRIA